MNEEQEKELFETLGTIVHGVNGIKSDVREIKIVLDKHSHILDEHTRVLDEHSSILSEHSVTLKTLVAKVDSVAETVMKNDRRLGVVEKHVDDLQGEVH